MRFPAPFARRVQALCDQLVDDQEEELLEALHAVRDDDKGIADVSKAMCGARGLAVCKDRKGKWFGKRSPFAYGPEYMTKEHDEL